MAKAEKADKADKGAKGQAGRRLTIICAALAGALGVGLSAMAAHLADGHLLAPAATMLLVHAPALLALALWQGRLRLAVPATLVLLLGMILFSADLGYRTMFGSGMFPMAAPTGGVLMILGWILVGTGAIFRVR